jgi:hypothetical protein
MGVTKGATHTYTHTGRHTSEGTIWNRNNVHTTHYGRSIVDIQQSGKLSREAGSYIGCLTKPSKNRPPTFPPYEWPISMWGKIFKLRSRRSTSSADDSTVCGGGRLRAAESPDASMKKQ